MVQLVLDGGLVQRQIVVGHLAFVEPIKGDFLAVGRPPHGGVLFEFLAIDPARGAVFDAVFVAAVGGQLGFATFLDIGKPKVARAIKGFALAVW